MTSFLKAAHKTAQVSSVPSWGREEHGRPTQECLATKSS